MPNRLTLPRFNASMAAQPLFSFSETFVVDPTGEIGENIIVEELRAAAEAPGAFLLARPMPQPIGRLAL
jgi:hypothetical protein